MTTLDDRLVPKVVSLIDKYGQNIAVEIEQLRSFDASTGKMVILGPTKYKTLSDGSALKSTPPSPDSKAFQPLFLSQKAECAIIIPASGLRFEPQKGMKIFFEDNRDEEWKVVAIERYKSGESVAAWELALSSNVGEDEF